MRRPIQLLNPLTINQIAAGEVIENPTSVVKELVENSLDAGADEIEIETLGGGQGLIIVKDNGYGFKPEDIPLALQRHATSKIAEFSDIFSLNSFGFRGEALPSIASISKMEIHSSVAGNTGVKSIIHGGDIVSSEPCARQMGTTIIVNSLFYNVPVRRQFQKSPQSHRLGIRKLIENGILAKDNIGWSWISEGKREMHFSKQKGFQERVAYVMGENFMRDALTIDKTDDFIRIIGFLGSPNFHRPTRQGQKIFINDRPIESSFISRQVGDAYSLLLPLQRYPVFILKLYLPAAWCDFNVHPQKIEARILKDTIVGNYVKEAVLETLTRPPMVHGVHNDVKSIELPTFSILQTNHLDLEESNTLEFSQNISQLSGANYCLETKNNKPHVSNLEIDWTHSRDVRFLTSLGRVVLAEDLEGVHAIFTAAARKQLFFLSLMQSNQQIHQSQTLLIPICLQVTPQEAAFFSDHKEVLCHLGIEISQVGPCTFSIESAPNLIGEEELKAWLLLLAATGSKEINQETLASLIQATLAQTMFSKCVHVFDSSWLILLWSLGKPEKAFDGTRIRRLILDSDFIEG
ncbi:DNA mismatch repair protein mutL,DNA mismatch repair protein,DNA mismatch repair enzyme (predicted ATPase),DNA mismatch repair protein MutL,DNA mismatch repair protein, C-terminal domain [Chlamydia serpentis]|uniref:DNA mismatch repair protein MutL n=1 Tax=Chlamydia serpentis TaxID=1967782 RepID=A0A2R8FBX9_9CHLA|nr:DNA mismatch repair endonuclease MutL [Chlamydia serpentis]SPN73924.1 DNA mismatch repair protein mutL,DNA mismatch repair protein,DNA mismatch repair enzyme (predicted ATPase),DNA mismatch repair protein MutL,DNA mismatch repair protein, C-terminal domain [Chlamydia serpentis]